MRLKRIYYLSIVDHSEFIFKRQVEDQNSTKKLKEYKKKSPVLFALKFLIASIWVGVAVYMLLPTFLSLRLSLLPSTGSYASTVGTVSGASTINKGNLGLVLEPMRPLSERVFTSTFSAASNNAQESVNGYYISGSFTTRDLRVLALQNYLSSKQSPMAQYADLIVATSDEAGINYQTFVAISGVESGYGTVGYAARVGSNPIGWRGGPGGKFNIFSGWDESIRYLIPRLARGYGSDPDPFAVQSTYCPPCGAAGTNEWANGVASNKLKIQAYYDALK